MKETACAQDRPATLHSEFLLQIVGELADPQYVGETPLGARRIVYLKRGSFSGPKLKGEVLPGGGDWVLARRDGVAQRPTVMSGCACRPGFSKLRN